MTDRTKRPSITRIQRLRMLAAANGRCHICGLPIAPGDRWDVEHKRALCLLGEAGLAYCAPAHIECHKIKTRDDLARLTKARRQAKAGAKRSKHPLPCGRDSPWKRTFRNGTIRRG